MINIFTFTESGCYGANEDAWVAQLHPADSALWICALADGQGGRPGGAEAAHAACQSAVAEALSYSPKQLTRRNTWTKILGVADRTVRDSPEAGFTTLVALCVTERVVCGASSGDSAAIALNVRDRHHALTAKQTKNPPIGSGCAQYTPFKLPLIEPWLVLLMSDGVWKDIGWNSLFSLIKQHEGAAVIEGLKEAAWSPERAGFRDDFTVVAAEFSIDMGQNGGNQNL